MGRYTHYTTEERELSMVIYAQECSVREISRTQHLSASTVSREINRNKKADGTYSADHAEKLYKKRRKNCGKKPILKEGKSREYVLEKLNLRWTPEQIAGRAGLDKESFSVSYATIYRAIDSGVLPKGLKKTIRFK